MMFFIRWLYRRRLTRQERNCCHMSQWAWSSQPLAQWREEFKSISCTEHCNDCPLLLVAT
jgi:hypothetical protein